MPGAEIATLENRVVDLTLVLTDGYNRLGLPTLENKPQTKGNTIDELDDSLIHLLCLAKEIVNQVARL